MHERYAYILRILVTYARYIFKYKNVKYAKINFYKSKTYMIHSVDSYRR
jgi:hypothetical protein